jgi:hypothetical protein
VLGDFDFAFKPLRRMATMDSGGKDRFSVRSYYARLVCGFLEHTGHAEHPAVVERLLSIKGFVLPLFANTQCFAHDTAPTLGRLVQSLHEGVAAAPGVARKVKLMLFTSKTLERLGSLYSNTAAVEPRPQPAMSGTAAVPDQAPTVRSLVHALLMCICTSAETGIVFLPRKPRGPLLGDAEGGDTVANERGPPSSVTGNPVLLRFIMSVASNIDDPLVRELTLAVLRNCPDIVATYARDGKVLTEPKLSTSWLVRAAFVGDVLDMPVSEVAVMTVTPAAVAALAIPIDVQSGAVLHGLQSKCRLLQFTVLKIMCTLLRRIRSVLALLPPTRRVQLLEATRRRLPGLELILSARHMCFLPLVGDEAAANSLAQSAVLQVLVGYSELLPDVFIASKVVIGKLVPSPEDIRTLPASVVTQVRPCEVQQLPPSPHACAVLICRHRTELFLPSSKIRSPDFSFCTPRNFDGMRRPRLQPTRLCFSLSCTFCVLPKRLSAEVWCESS